MLFVKCFVLVGLWWGGVMWCDVVWCGVVWCGMAWRDVAWYCGVIGFSKIDETIRIL